MTDNMQGWELLLHIVKSELKKKEDVLAALIHFALFKYNFKCVGKSENWSDDDTISECLPEGWNSEKEYIIRYKRNNEKFLLMSNHTDETAIIFNLTISGKLKVSNVIFNFNDTVKSIDGDIATMIPTYKDALKKINENLISPFVDPEKSHMETQTAENKVREPSCSTLRERVVSQMNHDFNNPLMSVGRRDLDPLAAMGSDGGMLFNPFSDTRSRIGVGPGIPEPLPRGAVPPHARFDPFGPPDVVMPSRRNFPPDYDDIFS